MKRKNWKIIYWFNGALIIALAMNLLLTPAHALVPVESLVLGDFSEDYSENKSDPLNYVFSKEKSLKEGMQSYKESLAHYRGFYEEGKNLENYCSLGNQGRYRIDWERTQVKRSIMGLMQYIGLDIATRAIPQYAKALEFTSDEYTRMVTGLVGNYCSNNLSVISKKELLNNFMLKYEKENNFKLPTIDGNPLFPDRMSELYQSTKAIEQEFLYTVKIFQSLCSWSGDPNNPGLLVPFLKHNALMAFFSRQMGNIGMEWRSLDNTIFLVSKPDTAQVWCDNLICRKVTTAQLREKFHFSVGGTNIYDDYKRLYCDDFRNADYRPKQSDPRLAKMMNSMTFEEENFMRSQFIALLTGYPDFFVRAENFKQGEEILRAGIDYTWNQWASASAERFTSELYFEEPLMLELVDRDLYYNVRSGELKVAFDVNMGEFDRINQISGKIKMSFKLKVQNSFLDYYRRTVKNLDYKEQAEKTRLKERFKMQIATQVKEAREKLIIPSWRGDLEELIVNELTTQIAETPEKFLKFDSKGDKDITIDVNYGVFALKYLNHQLNVKKNEVQSYVLKKSASP